MAINWNAFWEWANPRKFMRWTDRALPVDFGAGGCDFRRWARLGLFLHAR